MVCNLRNVGRYGYGSQYSFELGIEDYFLKVMKFFDRQNLCIGEILVYELRSARLPRPSSLQLVTNFTEPI